MGATDEQWEAYINARYRNGLTGANIEGLSPEKEVRVFSEDAMLWPALEYRGPGNPDLNQIDGMET